MENGLQKSWQSKALSITFHMGNKGKWNLVALGDGEGICRPRRQRKKWQAYVAGGGEAEENHGFSQTDWVGVYFLKIRCRNYESFGCI